MADCVKCGKKLGFFNYSGAGDKCVDCIHADHMASREANREQARLNEETRSAEIEAIVLTTETASSLNIIKRIEIVTAECAFGMNIFKDLFAGVRDIVGGRSEAVQKTMRDARKTALYELKREAHLVGANAVIGVDLDYVELSNVGSMIMLIASGTAVIVEEQIT